MSRPFGPGVVGADPRAGCGMPGDARSIAALTNEMSDISGKPVTFPWDADTTGCTAPVVFNGPVTTTAPGSTATASTGAANAPGTDGQSQDLAATGGGGNTPLIAGGAGLVLAAGAGIVVVSRRRRTAARH